MPSWHSFSHSHIGGCSRPGEICPREQPANNKSTMDEENNSELPIAHHCKEIQTLVQRHSTTIICGETGCGKTTQVPQFLYGSFRHIMVTQPRRISAITLAERVASEMGCQLGKEVGYCVRFEQKRCKDTRITFMTDGMAIRQLMVGRAFDAFLLDEAHERSINTDVLMALLRARLEAAQNKKHRPFKLVIMSATIEATRFMDFFRTDSIVRVEGRTYPTQVFNVLEPVEDYLQASFNCIWQIHVKQKAGDILVFLTGQQDILTLSKKLAKAIDQHSIQDLEVLMLYSALPHEHQHRIFAPHSNNKRRVILATNIAETSITIQGLRYVVDTGFMKVRTFDPNKNIDLLRIMPISKANALQRAGRAGREAEGKCFRLYTKNDYDDIADQMVPEILRSELSGPILQLKAIGVPAIRDLQFMDQPSAELFDKCLSLLRELKCITPDEKITEYGLQVSKIPLAPYLSNLLVQSYEMKCHQIMLFVLSALSIDNLFFVSKETKQKNNLYEVIKKYTPIIGGRQICSDHLAKANLLHEYAASTNKKNFCKGNFLNKNNVKRAILIHDQLEEYLNQIIQNRMKTSFDTKPVAKKEKFTLTNQKVAAWMKCMEKNSPYHTAKINKENQYVVCFSGQVASVHPESLAFYLKPRPPQILFYQIVKTNKLYLRDVTVLDSFS